MGLKLLPDFLQGGSERLINALLTGDGQVGLGLPSVRSRPGLGLHADGQFLGKGDHHVVTSVRGNAGEQKNERRDPCGGSAKQRCFHAVPPFLTGRIAYPTGCFKRSGGENARIYTLHTAGFRSTI